MHSIAVETCQKHLTMNIQYHWTSPMTFLGELRLPLLPGRWI
jgi:hypothetical protein